MSEETEVIVKQECRVCGAQYTSGSPAKRLHVHNDGWKRVKVTVPKQVWVVQCQVEYRTDDGWTGSKQVQTFQLDPRYVGDDLERVTVMAREIVNPCRDRHVTWVHVSAVLS